MNRIFITTQFEGFHRWKDAPEEVEFLRIRHRHMFHVRVEAEIHHDERDIEFILFKREVNKTIQDILNQNDTLDWSCETWARTILKSLEHHNVKMTCEVNEDGENGAIIENY